MPNQLIRDFLNTTDRLTFEWLDNPRGFIFRYLSDNADTHRNEKSVILWRQAKNSDRKEATSLLTLMGKAMPKRNQHQLVYTLAPVKTNDAQAHVTLLGPTRFPTEDKLKGYLHDFEKVTNNYSSLILNVSDIVKVSGANNSELEAHSLTHSLELQELHNELVSIALTNGGSLLELRYSLEHYLPHVTCTRSCDVNSGDELLVDTFTVSLHPGATLNVKHAVNIASVTLT